MANAVLGLLFWLLALGNTVLMFKLWGYPFDHERMVSAAPRPLMLTHRVIGYAFAGIYLFLMTRMVPRMWEYQVELPARTVVHLTMGLSIGIILVVKILIVRFFKHLESSTVPFLGILLLVCTTVLIGLSVPIALREAYLGRGTAGGAAVQAERLERVKELLPQVGLPPSMPLAQVASAAGLARGRAVLLGKCVQCHDLRTVLARPRTPAAWVETVTRMAERSVFAPISEEERWNVVSYLVAISPDLQRAVERKRARELAQVPAAEVLQPGGARPGGPAAPSVDVASAKATFESTCKGCHALSRVERSPPRSAAQARALVARMVENGLDADRAKLEQIVLYLTETYGR
jgi:mono/diheme cytochrome c family protein